MNFNLAELVKKIGTPMPMTEIGLYAILSV